MTTTDREKCPEIPSRDINERCKTCGKEPGYFCGCQPAAPAPDAAGAANCPKCGAKRRAFPGSDYYECGRKVGGSLAGWYATCQINELTATNATLAAELERVRAWLKIETEVAEKLRSRCEAAERERDAERERCAEIADAFASDMRRQAELIDDDAGEGAGDNCREHADAGDSIAAMIRCALQQQKETETT